MEKLQIGKIQAKYLLLEILLCLEHTQIFEFLFHLSRQAREYLVKMHKFIKLRSPVGYMYKENY
jgi:hypothetical protein